MRPKTFELLMALALLFLVGGFVIPRVLHGAPELPASSATALSLALNNTYALWVNNGGLHGHGDHGDTRLLTQNLLSCFTRPVNFPYVSASISQFNLGPSGVYEKPSLFPSPSLVRLPGFTHASLKPLKDGVLLAGHYKVLFTGQHFTCSAY